MRLPAVYTNFPAGVLVKSLLFSPSVGYQATAHDVNGNPIRKPISEAIWSLNDGADRLDDGVSTFGQIYSVQLRLGGNIGNTGFNLLHGGAVLGKLIPGDFKKMRRFVLKNTGRFEGDGWRCNEIEKTAPLNWACNGDNTVPAISQRLVHLPGFSRGDKPLHSTRLREISHADASGANGETGQVLEITRILDEMVDDLQ